MNDYKIITKQSGNNEWISYSPEFPNIEGKSKVSGDKSRLDLIRKIEDYLDVMEIQGGLEYCHYICDNL